MREAEEVGQQLQPLQPTFLRVELSRHYIIHRQYAAKIDTVTRLSGDHVPILRVGVIAVHEVEFRIVGNSGKHGVFNALFDLVPTDVRHL